MRTARPTWRASRPAPDKVRRCPAAQCHRQDPQADLTPAIRFTQSDRHPSRRLVTSLPPRPKKPSSNLDQEEVRIMKNKKLSLLASNLISVAAATALSARPRTPISG